MKIRLRRVNEAVHFVAENTDGNTLHLDGSPAVGGVGAGFRPMEAVLAALAGCAVIDIIEILKKQRQNLTDISIDAEGDRHEGRVTAPFSAVRLIFTVSGRDLDEDKVRKAVALGVEKYCSVGEMVGKTAEISHETVVLEA